MSVSTVGIPATPSAHRYTRNYVNYGLTRLNQSGSFTQRVAQYYTSYFKDCPFYDPFDENGQCETRCSVSGKETALVDVHHHVPLITGFPGPGLRICLEKDNDKVRNAVSAFFEKLRHDMGPYPCYTDGPTIRTIGREEIPGLNVPNEQEKHELYEIAVDYREKELRIICEVWNKGLTQDLPLSTLIRSNPSVSFSKILDSVIPNTFMGVYIKNLLLPREVKFADSSTLKERSLTVVSKKRKTTGAASNKSTKTSLSPAPSQVSIRGFPITSEKSETSQDSTSKKPKTSGSQTSVSSTQASITKTSTVSKIVTTVALEADSSPRIFPKTSDDWIEKSFGPFIIRGATDILDNSTGTTWTIKRVGNTLVVMRPRFEIESERDVVVCVVNGVATIRAGIDLFYVSAPKFQNLSACTTTKDNQYMITVQYSSDGRDMINAIFT